MAARSSHRHAAVSSCPFVFGCRWLSGPVSRVLAFGGATAITTRKHWDWPQRRPTGGGHTVAQTIEGFVGTSLDNAKISPLHVKVIALIAAGYFFDVIDLIVLGSLIPDMLATKFATGPEAGWIGSATVLGMFIGAAGQGQFSDRWGRK